MLSLSIQPLIVFDGPYKPPLKRNQKTDHRRPVILDNDVKELLGLLGIPYHDAPGEAEAECALLQQEGVVDAVLTEDVDVLMFGCRLSMRKWSAESSRGNKVSTHVSVYDSEKIRNGASGLTRWGMVLVALMSGGDYNTAGVPGCGPKVACEAARAGFGDSLCELSTYDTAGLREWRERLLHELRTNESGFFRIKHSKLQIPEEFPMKDILGYYKSPVVSAVTQIRDLGARIQWASDINISSLRLFVARCFEWSTRAGAKKFIRGIAPVLLVRKMQCAGNAIGKADGHPERETSQVSKVIQSVCGHRQDFSNDGVPELRVTYIPSEIVQLDLDAEEPDQAIQNEHDLSAPIQETTSSGGSGDEANSVDTTKPSSEKRAGPKYDPSEPQKAWIWERFVRAGAAAEVQQWEDQLNQKKKKPTKSARKVDPSIIRKSGGMKRGAIEPYVKTTKAGIMDRHVSAKAEGTGSILPSALVAAEEVDQQQVQIIDLDEAAEPLAREFRSRSSSAKVSSRTSNSKYATRARTKGTVTKRKSVPSHSSRSTSSQQTDAFSLPPSSAQPSSATYPPRSAASSSFGPTSESTITISSSPSPSPPPPSSAPRPQQQTTPVASQGKAQRRVCLRRSLEGAWKEVDSAQKVGLGKRIWESVEVIDLG